MTAAGFTAVAKELHLDEGCRLTAYLDTRGVPTIGFGATGPDIHLGIVWTQAQADARLAFDIARFEAALERDLPWFAKLDDPRAEAVANLAFNLGEHGLLAWHRTLTDIQDGRYMQAAEDVLTNHTWTGEVGMGRADRIATLLRAPAVTTKAPATVVAWANAATKQAMAA